MKAIIEMKLEPPANSVHMLLGMLIMIQASKTKRISHPSFISHPLAPTIRYTPSVWIDLPHMQIRV